MMERHARWKDIQNRFKNYIPNTIKYSFDNNKTLFNSGKGIISVHNDDTLDFPIINNIDNPLILIFADDVNPGGCIESGNGMQEECLFRRTALFKYMSTNLYPLKHNESLYCANVPVIRMSEIRNNQEIPQMHYSFIASSCLKYPSKPMKPEEIDMMKMKIELILRIAKHHSHKNIILGAWGCGAYGCDPREIAELFKNVCSQHNFRYYFVILGKAYQIFKDVLMN